MALFGIYPLAEPSHWEWDLLTLLDWGAHFLGMAYIWLKARAWYYRNADRTVGEVLFPNRYKRWESQS